MKQFQFQYSNLHQLRSELRKIQQWRATRITSCVSLQVFSEKLDQPMVDDICRVISETIPDALYMGCSTNGSICNGEISKAPVSIACTVYEFPTTKIDVVQYQLTDETARDVAADLCQKVSKSPWIKAVEMFVTIRGMSMTVLCEELQKIRENVAIFGGGAFADDLNEQAACVFSSAGGYSEHGVTFLLIGGADFFVNTTYVAGWKPLGRTFRVTKAHRNMLYELDGSPAYDVYYNYLNIRNDSHFFTNSLEFPFFCEHNGIKILRAPTASNADGSLTMTSDIDEGVCANLAYGDPWTILEEIRQSCGSVREFAPEVIHLYSCAARRTFWGNAEISRESMPFQRLAPTAGFYTSSEFLRTNGKMNQHNVTLVVAAMREGDAVVQPEDTSLQTVENEYSGKVSMINRLATFIGAATRELEQTNEKLALAAITDGMTGLYNRTEIQRRIGERLDSGERMSLIMVDLDNFKHVNDTYGHQEGDRVIMGLAELFRDGTAKYDDVYAGRWGGEEFMILLPWDVDSAEKSAHCLRCNFRDLEFPAAGHQTLSLGVTQARAEDSLDDLLVRVDKALYEAKRTGKDRYVIL